MNIIHDMPKKRIRPNNFQAVIEIGKGGKVKYEVDKETGLLSMDRVLHTSMQYPTNYGVIPRTLAQDGDPLDVLVLCSETLLPMSLVRCYPVGMLLMTDEDELDQKILAIPFNDPLFDGYTEIKELPAHATAEIEHFFSVYKDLEGKTTSIDHVAGAEEAQRAILLCMEQYEQFRCANPYCFHQHAD